MSSQQLNPLAQEDLDSTADEDLNLSLKVKQLHNMKYQASKDCHQSLEKTTIRRLDFGDLVKLTPFQKQLTETLASTKSDFPESKTFYANDSQDSLKASPAKSKQKIYPEGILKSGDKSKYIKWHQYLRDYQKAGTLESNNVAVNFMLPYFVKGKADNWEQWDKQKWQEDEEWWEADQWAVSSPTYAKYKEESFSDYGFGSY